MSAQFNLIIVLRKIIQLSYEKNTKKYLQFIHVMQYKYL